MLQFNFKEILLKANGPKHGIIRHGILSILLLTCVPYICCFHSYNL